MHGYCETGVQKPEARMLRSMGSTFRAEYFWNLSVQCLEPNSNDETPHSQDIKYGNSKPIDSAAKSQALIEQLLSRCG